MNPSTTPPPRQRAGLPTRFATFLRSALAGGAATLADLAVIAFATAVLHVSPAAANVPALLVGAVVQFFGNRHFAFRAGSGSIRRQAVLFALTELVAFGLNAALYHAVVSRIALGPAGAVLARAITTNAVFLLVSYPLWNRVFRPEAAARA
jgi:putative flippase GtrA